MFVQEHSSVLKMFTVHPDYKLDVLYGFACVFFVSLSLFETETLFGLELGFSRNQCRLIRW